MRYATAASLALAASVVAMGIGANVASSRAGADCSRTSVGLTPLSDLGAGAYRGFQGGLYPGGRNVPSATYLKQGLAAAKLVKPVNGKIVLLSIGMSNTTQEFSEFKREADADARKNPRLVIVDGAQGGKDAETIKSPAAPFWSVIDERLAAAGVTRAQVQAVWLKQAIAREQASFPDDARHLQTDLRAIVGILRGRYPRLRLIYVSSRTYAGYATTNLNPEPIAYDSGFAVKWLVQERSEGKLAAPWIGWGPYLWTDGTKGRTDGLVWTCADVRPSDGTHPSPSGQQKVAGLLRRFFAASSTSKGWYLHQ